MRVVQDDRRLLERIDEFVARRYATTAAAKTQLSLWSRLLETQPHAALELQR